MLSKFQSNRRGGFTLVEIMIVVAIIALLAAIAVPSALRARKRSQATSTLETLRILDSACDQWAIETGQSSSASPAASTLQAYVKKGTKLYTDLGSGHAYDAISGDITLPKVDVVPQIPTATYTALSDVAGTDFWGPYYTSGS
jgi:prepilin-type N-terminal cleavage/methylation domain-containing protein